MAAAIKRLWPADSIRFAKRSRDPGGRAAGLRSESRDAISVTKIARAGVLELESVRLRLNHAVIPAKVGISGASGEQIPICIGMTIPLQPEQR